MNRLPQKTSLVSQTVAVILEEIEARHWSCWLPGEHDLCARLHVSRRTVRAALEQLTKRGVLKSAQGKRREIIGLADQRRKSATRRVVVLLPMQVAYLSPFGLFLIDLLREQLAEEGYLLETHSSRVPYRARVPHELDNLEQALHPAGWVLLHSTEQMQRWFSERHLPCVVLGSRYPGVALSSVDTNYGALCHHAVGQFLARGRQNQILLNPEPEAAGDVKTREEFLAATRKAGQASIRAEVIHHGGNVGSVCVRLDTLLSRSQPPNAILVSRAQHVLTVVGHLLRRGLRISEDVAVISRDDESFLEDVVPSVARYCRNPKVFAAKVSRRVLRMVTGETRVVDHQIMPSFVGGQTLD